MSSRGPTAVVATSLWKTLLSLDLSTCLHNDCMIYITDSTVRFRKQLLQLTAERTVPQSETLPLTHHIWFQDLNNATMHSMHIWLL